MATSRAAAAYTAGYGTNVLSGANNYSGTTTITAGTLRLGANRTLPNGTPLTILRITSTGGGGLLTSPAIARPSARWPAARRNGGTGSDTPTSGSPAR